LIGLKALITLFSEGFYLKSSGRWDGAIFLGAISLKILFLDNVGLAYEIIIGKIKNQESETKK
jgi:hypothetical protein